MHCHVCGTHLAVVLQLGLQIVSAVAVASAVQPQLQIEHQLHVEPQLGELQREPLDQPFERKVQLQQELQSRGNTTTATNDTVQGVSHDKRTSKVAAGVGEQQDAQEMCGVVVGHW